jgi:hypothetical protein
LIEIWNATSGEDVLSYETDSYLTGLDWLSDNTLMYSDSEVHRLELEISGLTLSTNVCIETR